MNGLERGRQEALRRQGINEQPNPYDQMEPTGLNRGKLNAIARYSTDLEQRRNAAATLRRWDTTPPAEDDSGTAA